MSTLPTIMSVTILGKIILKCTCKWETWKCIIRKTFFILKKFNKMKKLFYLVLFFVSCVVQILRLSSFTHRRNIRKLTFFSMSNNTDLGFTIVIYEICFKNYIFKFLEYIYYKNLQLFTMMGKFKLVLKFLPIQRFCCHKKSLIPSGPRKV